MVFHPARVVKKINPSSKDIEASDGSIQATLEMWDGNVFTFNVKDEIADKVETDSIVLVDYRPKEGTKTPVPRQEVIKVLKGSSAEDVWKRYEDFKDKRKQSQQTSQGPQLSYMG